MKTKNKQIYFFPRFVDWILFREDIEDDNNITPCITYIDTELAINRGDNIIHTTSLSHLKLNIDGYDVYIVNKGKTIHVYEGLKIPNGCELNKYHDLIEMIKIDYFNNL